MRRVCIISTCHRLKDSRIYHKQAISLKKAGYDITCIFLGEKDTYGITQEEIKFIEIQPIPDIKSFTQNLIQYSSYVYGNFSESTFNKIEKVCIELQCDIYHLHDLYLLQLVPKLKHNLRGVKIVYDVHESYPDIILDYNKKVKNINKYLYFAYIYLWELRFSLQCDYIINVEESINKRFQNHIGKNATSIIFNYPIIKEEVIKTIRENYKKRKYDLIYCGGITTLRGCMEILQVIKVSKEKGNPLSVIFVGEIQEGCNKINEYIEENKLEDQITFTGVVPFDEVEKYYLNSKIGLVLLHDIKKFRRAIPIKLFEYMIQGLPVIGSDLPQISKIVQDINYPCGMIVNIFNPLEIYEKIIKILQNEKIYSNYSNNGIKLIQNKYNWTLEEIKLIKVYDKLF